LNNLKIQCLTRDITGEGPVDADVILAGDVCYASPMSRAVVDWLALQDARVLIADPGRAFLPDTIAGRRLKERASYDVPVLLELESHSPMHTRVLELG
jgi:predicted nicotinamide N-methyase